MRAVGVTVSRRFRISAVFMDVTLSCSPKERTPHVVLYLLLLGTTELLLLLLTNQPTLWPLEPGGSMPHSRGLSNNPNPQPNQPNIPY